MVNSLFYQLIQWSTNTSPDLMC